MRIINVWMSLVTMAMLSGCGAEPIADEDSSGVTDDALTTENALTENAISENALTENAITENAITENAITENAITENALAAIQNPGAQGALNRDLLRYMIACAFKPNQSFDFTWTDSSALAHNEHYVGQLGLAPEWRTGPLSRNGKYMVSACLASKTNYYGVHVTISVRSEENPLRLHPHDDELDDYSHVEGAFWGNIFGDDPYLFACYNSANVANSRAYKRDCAAGHLNADGTKSECGIIDSVGSCASVCKKYNSSRGYYSDCRERPGISFKRTDRVITTALP